MAKLAGKVGILAHKKTDANMQDLKRLAKTVEAMVRRNKSSAGVTVPVLRVPEVNEDEEDVVVHRPVTRSQTLAAERSPVTLSQRNKPATQAQRVEEDLADKANGSPAFHQRLKKAVERLQHATSPGTSGSPDESACPRVE